MRLLKGPAFYAFLVYFALACVAATYACRDYRASNSAAARDWTKITTSPTGEYQIRFHGWSNPPAFGDYATGFHGAKFSVSKRGAEFMAKERLYRGGFYDDYFADQYPVQEWVGESTLRLGSPSEGSDDQ